MAGLLDLGGEIVRGEIVRREPLLKSGAHAAGHVHGIHGEGRAGGALDAGAAHFILQREHHAHIRVAQALEQRHGR